MHAAPRDLPVNRPRTADAAPLSSRWFGALLWTSLALAGCGGGATGVIDSNPVNGTTLMGTWTGSVNGDGAPGNYGYSTTVTELKSDSTLIMTAASQLYGTVSGVWTVANGKWTSTARDRDNVLITFTAPASAFTLTGTWTASSGKTGTFTMAKIS